MSAVLDRFMDKVVPVTESGCWLWTADTSGQRYGRFKLDGKTLYAHRVAWTLMVGPIPDGGFICHKCDTPLCVNPDHLFVSDHKGNMRDMDRKGRRRVGVGERHGKAKLTESQVLHILSSDMRIVDLARKFGVSSTAIHLIRTGKNWKGLTAAAR